MRIAARVESWDFEYPFRISRGEMTAMEVVKVELTGADGAIGRSEAAGIDYDGETPESIIADIMAIEHVLDDNVTGDDLLSLLPPGGARNALDCALWDLNAKRSGVPAWRTAGLSSPRPVITAFTIGIGSETETRAKARAIFDWPLIKIKVDGDTLLDPLRIVAEEAPGARFIVDANQAWTVDMLNRLQPILESHNVVLLEQPIPVGEDRSLAYYRGHIPVAADESCVDRASLPGLTGLYQAVNIKLDKTGGLTEALHLSRAAQQIGFQIMVGCMCGTSLAIAPAAFIAQMADFVDLDGPLLQRDDCSHGLSYDRGRMSFPAPELWG